jgi:hypothetical protein
VKITDVTLTLFSWERLPPTQYASGLSNLSHAPHGPGLGVEIDFGLIERNRIAVL